MSLIRWDPFNLFKPSAFWSSEEEGATPWMPTVDVSENDSEMTFKAELPGVELKDITVSVENNILTIKGERKFEKETEKENYHRVERMYGRFSRSFALPTAVDESHARAEFKNGVLKVVLLKKEHAKSRGIEIKAA